MRLFLIGSILLSAGCAGTGGTASDSSQPLDRACSVEDCFMRRDVRDFEVIDNTTLVVYVGGQRCAFQIELDGTFCDMSLAPEIYFRMPAGVDDGRICSADRRVRIDGGVFTDSIGQQQPIGVRRPGGRGIGSIDPADRFGVGQGQGECQIRSIASITDDQLLELYVARGIVPPPPPIGPGEITVGEPREPSEEEGASEAAPAAPTDDASAPAPDAGQLRTAPP